MKEVHTGFFATYEDQRDLRRYVPVATEKIGGRFSWQRWYLPPGFYKITIEPWFPSGMEPFEGGPLEGEGPTST